MAQSITINANGKPFKDFIAACALYRHKLGNAQHVAMRRGMINLLSSFRAATLISDKMVPKSDVAQLGKSRKLADGTKMARFKVTRRAKTNRESSRYVDAATPSEARRKYGTLKQRGLAKLAWAKLQASLFKGALNKSGYKATPPRDIVDGFYRFHDNIAYPSVSARFRNKLSYASEALAAPIDAILAKARNSIVTQIERNLAKARGGLE